MFEFGSFKQFLELNFGFLILDKLDENQFFYKDCEDKISLNNFFKNIQYFNIQLEQMQFYQKYIYKNKKIRKVLLVFNRDIVFINRVNS